MTGCICSTVWGFCENSRIQKTGYVKGVLIRPIAQIGYSFYRMTLQMSIIWFLINRILLTGYCWRSLFSAVCSKQNSVIVTGYIKHVIKWFLFLGLVHKSQMSKSRVEDPSEMLATGEKVYCKVISVEVWQQN